LASIHHCGVGRLSSDSQFASYLSAAPQTPAPRNSEIKQTTPTKPIDLFIGATPFQPSRRTAGRNAIAPARAQDHKPYAGLNPTKRERRSLIWTRMDCHVRLVDSLLNRCYHGTGNRQDCIPGEDDLAGKMMKTHGAVTHDRSEETMEAKARWFQSLPLSERMEMLCSITDLALTVNPALQERKDAQPVAGRIQVLSAT
jgi:hypothetical protein